MASRCLTESTPAGLDTALVQAALVGEFRALVGTGADFAKLRKSVGVSAREFSKWCPLDPRTLRKFEDGKIVLSTPQMARVLQFAHACRSGVLAG